ncbi:avidin/streptavidin family protein [Bradyrhizobium archetypum]|uniref:avidin/streptavidin family protein n=1 Tax=Bradyrhizobium archetypum TaxID=2721160 RepID=UPI001F18D14A|nr:avidin/streptavidin family protein [Bradyrhizobium archetypum]
MTWKGKWRNQYGSIVDITDDANRRISGTFKTALRDSGFYGQEIPIVGIHQGDCISFVAGGETAAGDAAVSTPACCATEKWKRCGSSSLTARSGRRQKVHPARRKN